MTEQQDSATLRARVKPALVFFGAVFLFSLGTMYAWVVWIIWQSPFTFDHVGGPLGFLVESIRVFIADPSTGVDAVTTFMFLACAVFWSGLFYLVRLRVLLVRKRPAAE